MNYLWTKAVMAENENSLCYVEDILKLDTFFPNISANKQKLPCAIMQISCRNGRGVGTFLWCSRALYFEFQQWKRGSKWLDQISVIKEGCISFVLLCLFSLYTIHIPEG